MEEIYINDYIAFDPERGIFVLSTEAQELLYRKKQIICGYYSGCVEWGHNFFCELLDLYSGNSQYSFAFGRWTVIYKDWIAKMYKEGHQEKVINWVNMHKDNYWFYKAAAMLANIIQDIPEW